MYGDKFDEYRQIQNSNLSASDTLDRLDSLRLLERNFLRVKILFDRRGIETLNNTSAMTWEDLASNIGGSLSLWIGITVMTLFELIELAYRLTSLLVFGHNLNIGDQSDISTSTPKTTAISP
jgi:Amiloride-sensitive sodium channel